MKRAMIAIVSILVVGTAAASASAETIYKRLHRHKFRIRQGVDSGELTRHEFRRLMHQQRKIRRQHHRAWHDGHLDYRELRYLHAKLDRASRRIYRLKHNSEYAHAHYRFHCHGRQERRNWWKACGGR